MNDNMELSLSKKSRSIPIIADSAKSIGITFSTINNNLYRFLSGNFSTFLVSGSARLISRSRGGRLRSSFQNLVEQLLCFILFRHYSIFISHPNHKHRGSKCCCRHLTPKSCRCASPCRQDDRQSLRRLVESSLGFPQC